MIHLVMMILSLSAFGADNNNFDRAKKIYSSLTSVRLFPAGKNYQKVKELAKSSDWDSIAALAVEDRRFYDLTLLSFSFDLLKKEGENTKTLDDLIAMIVGVTRDERDARTLLTGNFRYTPSKRISGEDHLGSNEKFNNLFKSNLSLKKYLKYQTPQWKNGDAYFFSGIFTTRGWAERYYNMGTNRIAVAKLIDSFLCSSVERWRSLGLNPTRIRRDIDRFPGGDPLEFKSKCITCHAGLDSLGGAFSKISFSPAQSRLVFHREVIEKFNQNGDVFPFGYVTVNDTWLNPFSLERYKSWGLPKVDEGKGPLELGRFIANSDRFKKCLAKKVIKKVCGKDLSFSSKEIERASSDFSQNGYSLKYLFKQAAVNYCQ